MKKTGNQMFWRVIYFIRTIKNFVKNSYKIVIGIFIGLLVAGIRVKAVESIYSKNITYDNTNSGITSTNL